MPIKLYMDEDAMDQDLVRALRARGVDVTTALDGEMIGCADMDHLDYATTQNRVLCTFNVGDFCRLHTAYVNQGKSHAGIVLMRQQHYAIGEQMRRLLRLVASRSSDDTRNQVEFLSAWG
jgi:hypothetical protein